MSDRPQKPLAPQPYTDIVKLRSPVGSAAERVEESFARGPQSTNKPLTVSKNDNKSR